MCGVSVFGISSLTAIRLGHILLGTMADFPIHRGKLVRLGGYAATAFALLICVLPARGHTDEVDDILALKAGNANRLRKFSAEFVVKTHQPKSLKDPKVLTMRYRMKMERITGGSSFVGSESNAGQPGETAKGAVSQTTGVKETGPHNPWRIETEVLEPLAMKMKVEGEQAWFQDQHGKWIELPMTPELREQFLGMSERYRGADPKVQRDRFAMKVLRHNNPIFGPKTRTLSSVPKGRSKLYARMEEDIDPDGLPLETRIYDDSGKQTVKVKVKKHHKVKGVPVVDEMESVAETPAGTVASETSCLQILLDIKE